MRPGMTVLPLRATRSAPAGTLTLVAGPAATMRPSRTTIVALATGARSLPSIRVNPVNAREDVACADESDGASAHAKVAAAIRRLSIGMDGGRGDGLQRCDAQCGRNTP